jgi:hypothetical protein
MSDRVTVRYKREPIMLLYNIWSTSSPFSSRSNEAAVLIRVDTGLSSSMLNFLIKTLSNKVSLIPHNLTILLMLVLKTHFIPITFKGWLSTQDKGSIYSM